MYAIVRTGGKQYKVKPGQKFTVEKLAGEKGTFLNLEDVLLVSAETDGEPMVGKPVVEGAKVECEVLSQAKGKKEIVFKFRRRKRYMRKKGHRQQLTMLKVKGVSCNGQVWTEEASK
jgi:large subunit ribosomal protein L21